MNQQLAQQILAQTRTSYNTLADKFSNTRRWEWPVMEKLIQQYVKDNDKILDVGCGNGRLYKSLIDKRVEYLGIDNSEKLIEIAKQSGGNFQVKDILNLGFNQEFNLIFAFAVINHLPSQELRERVLKNIFDSLKPGGLLIMTNWNMWKLSFKQKTVWRYKFKKTKRLKGLKVKDVMTYFNDGQGNKYPLYYYAFTLRELKRLVRKSGFKIVKSYYEQSGKKAHWWNGDNLVLVARKK